jgi:hypothetical protein
MPDAAEPVKEDTKGDHCPRCLQPVPRKASRCPGCGQPIRSTRLLTFAIGIAGLLVLLFAMLVMYRLVRNEDAANAPVPVDEDAAPQPLFPDPPPASTADDKAKPDEPAKPDKKAPLDEH